MSRTRIHNLSISLDGFATGEPQSAETPFGHAGQRLHEWLFATRCWAPEGAESGADAVGSAGVDDAFAQRHSAGFGAEVVGAGTSGPTPRAPRPDQPPRAGVVHEVELDEHVTDALPMGMDPFAALADPVRRALLRALAAGPARVVDLAADHPISRPAISKHLRLLTEAGLASVEDRGRERHYALDPSGLAPVSALLDQLRPAAPFADAALDALDLEVRRTVRERGAARRPDQQARPDQQEDTA